MHARLASEGDDVLGAGIEHLLRVVKGSHIVKVASRPAARGREGLVESDELVVCADAVDSASI